MGFRVPLRVLQGFGFIVVISGVMMSPLIWVISIVTLLLITTYEPPST